MSRQSSMSKLFRDEAKFVAVMLGDSMLGDASEVVSPFPKDALTVAFDIPILLRYLSLSKFIFGICENLQSFRK
eukprot:UN25389